MQETMSEGLLFLVLYCIVSEEECSGRIYRGCAQVRACREMEGRGVKTAEGWVEVERDMQETRADGGFFCVLLEVMDVLVADVMGISVLQWRRGVAKEKRCCKGKKVSQRRKDVAKEERCYIGG
jgi:hypothetical protein